MTQRKTIGQRPGAAEKHEKKILIEGIVRTKGNLKELAELLNIGRSTLYRKLDQHGIGMDTKRKRPNIRRADPPASPQAPRKPAKRRKRRKRKKA